MQPVDPRLRVYAGPVFTGHCPEPDCSVEFIATSRPELVKQFHDHLRDQHPLRWFRA